MTINLAGCATATISRGPPEPEASEEEIIVTTTEQTRRGPPPAVSSVSYRYLLTMAQSPDPVIRQRGYDAFRVRVRAGLLSVTEREALNQVFVPRGFIRIDPAPPRRP